MAIKGHLYAGGLVGPLAVIESGAANNIVGFDGSAVAGTRSLSNLLDAVIGSSRGTLLHRGASAWEALAPGTSGHFLKSNGAAADLSYAAINAAGRLVAGTPLVQNPVDLGEVVTQAHGLGVIPVHLKIEMECLSAEGGYVAGDIIRGGILSNYTVWLADATNTTLVVNSANFFIWRKDNFSSLAITASRWKITITPYALTTS